jgi:hypothetical protein
VRYCISAASDVPEILILEFMFLYLSLEFLFKGNGLRTCPQPNPRLGRKDVHNGVARS